MQKNVSPNLSVRFAGVEFRSPIGVAAVGTISGKGVTPEEKAEILFKLVDAGSGYIYVTRCSFLTEETERKLQEIKRQVEISKAPYAVRAMKIETRGARFGLEGMFGAFPGGHLDNASTIREQWPGFQKLVEILKKRKLQNVPLIASVTGLSDLPETYVDAAKKFEELGGDLVELNLGSPRALQMRGASEYYSEERFPPLNMGALLGDKPNVAEKIVREVVKAVSIPVGVKLTPETGFPRIIELVRRVKNAGAKFIHTLNLAMSIAPPDIYNRGRSPWPFANANPFVSASGPWLRPKLYRDVAVVTKLVPGIDIAAAGGMVHPEHCVEVMMLGARLTQLCTGVLLKSTKLIEQCDKFLRRFMIKEGYQTVEEIIGLAQQHICYREDADFMAGQVIAEVDEARCNNCGLCLNTLCVVIYSENGKPQINTERCTGCGRCIILCPKNAINYALRT